MAHSQTTNPSLLANLIFRVMLAFAGTLASWVPLRQLVRNGEFAAAVLVVDVAVMNALTVVNSLVWRDDRWDAWWDGAGLCDVEVYLAAPLQTVYAASVFAIVYRLARQVRVTGDGDRRGRRTRRDLVVQAAVIFSVPLVQLLFTYFDLAQRYIVGTLIGCSAVYDASWPKILVYDIPPAMFAILSIPYVFLLWRRYRAITKQAQGILKSDGEASIRANRTRRRLYNMALSILVVYVPVMVYYLVCNVQDTLSSYKPYDFYRIRTSATPYAWDTILFVPSWIIPSDVMNQPWIAIATTAVIVAFFGTTAEAQQTYRRYAERIGLGACVSKLQQWRRHPSPAPATADENGATRESKKKNKKLLLNRIRACFGYDSERDTILPITEPPNQAYTRPSAPIPQSIPSPTPAPNRTRTRTRTRTGLIPPTIPPRHSSLRHSFALRAPTLRSLRDSIRIPRRASRSRPSATTTAAGDGPPPPYRNSPVPTTTHDLRDRARRRCSAGAGSFLTPDARAAAVTVSMSSPGRSSGMRGRGDGDGDGDVLLEVRIPITRGWANRNGNGNGNGSGRMSSSREDTLGSFHTTTDTHTTCGSYS